ncbi:MAG: hypothetical protein ABR577_18800 [Pyrinomonadaceae bacterium]
MIRVNKPPKPPAVLTTKGKSKRRAHSVAYSRFARDYKSGAKKFDFDSKIYAHKTVKDELIKAQHDKCFLCESKITHIAFGDVEHFRPKGGSRQSEGDSLQKPGYYWLAYEWSNLFLACPLCNQLFKKNLFPLRNPKARAATHKDKLNHEEPLFIDPVADNPEEYISFREEIAYPLNGNPKGKVTINLLGLNRQKLNERRLEVYRRLRELYSIANLNPPIPESVAARTLINEAIQDDAEFAGMTRAALNAKFSLK